MDDRPTGHRVGQPRGRFEGVRRRRHRVRRPPRRLRRHGGRATPIPPWSRRSAAGCASGTHFAQPTEDAIVVAEELAGRFGLPALALHQLGHRGDHGRHPPDARHHRPRPHHQDRGQLPRPPRRRDGQLLQRGRRARAARAAVEPAPAARASPRTCSTWSWWCPSTTSRCWTARLQAFEGQVAGMIMEPMMMNAGIIPPAPGYLEGVRELTRRHGVLLAFDEVKTGLTVGPGGGDAAVRRPARHRVPGQGAGRRRAVRRHRRHGRGDGGHRRRSLRAGRHVQRQPAHHGRGPGHAHRGAHDGRLRARSTTSAG